LLIHDWLHRGFSHRALAAKYGLSLPVVKRLVTTYRRETRLAELRGTTGSGPASPRRGS
jgi:hypothetical protein